MARSAMLQLSRPRLEMAPYFCTYLVGALRIYAEFGSNAFDVGVQLRHCSPPA